MSIEVILHPCSHCEGEGTCKRDENGKTCVVCAMEYAKVGFIPKLKKGDKKSYYESFTGLICSCCGGLGNAETKTDRLNKRMRSILGFGIPYFLLLMCFISLLLKPEYLVNLLPFTAGILGAIVGFYFGDKKSS